MDLFSVIADPTRRRMIDMMRQGEQPAGAFVAAFPEVSQPAVSQHLKVLRDSGVATVRADRQRRLYTLNPEGLKPVEDWLSPHLPAPVIAIAQEPQRAKKPRPRPEPEPALTLDLFG